MTNQFTLPIHIFIRPSPCLASVIMVVHLGAALALCRAELPWLVKCIVMLFVIASIVQALRIHILQKHPAAAVQIMLTTDSEWWLTDANGHTCAVHLMSGAFVHPLFTVLSFQGEHYRYTVILTPDIVDADMFRRLRVRLRFQHSRVPP